MIILKELNFQRTSQLSIITFDKNQKKEFTLFVFLAVYFKIKDKK